MRGNLPTQSFRHPETDVSNCRRAACRVLAAASLVPTFLGAVHAQEPPPRSRTNLSIAGTQFAINGRAEFLLGISDYGILGAEEDAIRHDLEEMRTHGFNWFRLWATWSAFENDVSAVNATTGEPREPFLKKLRWLVEECDKRGVIVDVSFSRGNGVTGPPRLQTAEAHRRAVETVVTALKPFRNWYLDLSNERNIKDKRHTSFEELKTLRDLVRRLDPNRLVTSSHAGDISRDDLREYIQTVQVDFITPHRPRTADSPRQTEARTRDYHAMSRDLGRIVPVHYQEPFRRGFQSKIEPTADDFATDLKQAVAGGAAGWCFHNGDTRNVKDGRPRRGFDARDGRLFEQLDEVEKKVLPKLRESLTSNRRDAP